MISSSLFLSFFASIFGVFPEFSSKFPPRFFEAFSFSLSFFGAPYFAIAQYGLLSPYFAIAQYGLLSPYFAIAQRALGARGCTSFTPGCILAPFQGAHSHHKISHICRRQMSTHHRHLWRGGGRQAGAEVTFPSQNRQRPQRGRLFPLANYLTSAVGRCLHPIAIYGEGVADRPGLRSHSHRKIDYARNAGVFTPSPFMERGWPTGRG